MADAVRNDDALFAALEEAASAFLLPLREKDGVDAAALDALSDAIGRCAAYWRGRPEISKRVAALLNQIEIDSFSFLDRYEGETLRAASTAHFRLCRSIEACFQE